MWVGEAGACTAVRRAGQGYNALEGPAIAKGAGGVIWAAHLLDKLDDALSVAQLHHACRHIAGAQIVYKVRLRVAQGRAAAAGQ